MTVPSRWPQRPYGKQPIYPQLKDTRPWMNVTEDTTWMYRNGDLWLCPFCSRMWVLDSPAARVVEDWSIEVIFVAKTFPKPEHWRKETRKERKLRQSGESS